MPAASQALGAAAALLVGALAGCAAGVAARKEPVVELSFSAGARVPGGSDKRSVLVDADGALGIMWWQARGEPGPTHHYLGVGVVAVVSRFDLARTDLGVDVVVAPPRTDRRTGFQFRLGPRLGTTGDHGGVSFATEFADSWLGSLFAEAQYDFVGQEAAFLFGARVNLLFPVTYVRATMVPLD
jgi:hypothetical protein